MRNLRGPLHNPSSSSSEMKNLTAGVPEELDDWDGESSGTEQSFRTAYAAIPLASRKVPRKVSRKSRFIERFDSFKLTKENLAALQTGYEHVPSRPTFPIDNHFYPDPTQGTKEFRASRKPLPESARETVQKMRDEAVTRDHASPGSKSDSSPCPPRSNTNFTDFLPYHQLRTWQQDDDEEWQRRRAQSLSAVALQGMKRLNSSCDNLSIQSKKTANQLKEAIKRRVLDHDK